ncbi:hypothetical protein [Cyclobacterium jeungdonense]|uniref:Uncharacterized protein n=1 Tax=Cyclobacterium jeungdonense TaxID=708087 RepID=A0ABT8CD74_9BACT|nr:hypothetical protein [Cyclobacterium jeungdonense]MDN3690485.1 hypothetical protein [Cyclobacterium jeungdonense]
MDLTHDNGLNNFTYQDGILAMVPYDVNGRMLAVAPGLMLIERLAQFWRAGQELI